MNQFTGVVNTSVEFIEKFNGSYNLDNVNLFVSYINAFVMSAANSEFSLKIDAFPHSESEFKVRI